MTTFTLDVVRQFTDGLELSLNRCDNGEGMTCATLDQTLFHYADQCCGFLRAVREWSQQVFSGKIAFDPEVEKLWLHKGHALAERATPLLAYSQQAEIGCFVLSSQSTLRGKLAELSLLLSGWVTPTLAVGPAARHGLMISEEQTESAKKVLEGLPPLPTDWKPNDPRQLQQFQRLRRG